MEVSTANLCHSCQVIFNTRRLLLAHRRYYHGRGQCGQEYDAAALVMEEIKTQNNTTPFVGISVRELMTWTPGWEDSCEMAYIAHVMKALPEGAIFAKIFAVHSPARGDVAWRLFLNSAGECIVNRRLRAGYFLLHPAVAQDMLCSVTMQGATSLEMLLASEAFQNTT